MGLRFLHWGQGTRFIWVSFQKVRRFLPRALEWRLLGNGTTLLLSYLDYQAQEAKFWFYSYNLPGLNLRRIADTILYNRIYTAALMDSIKLFPALYR